MIKKFYGKMKNYLEDVFKIKENPHSIASGFALGTFLAILPTFGLGLFIGLFILLIFKGISKVSMIVSFIFWNPLILFPLYGLSYTIGDFLYSYEPGTNVKIEVASELYIYSTKFLMGNIILVVFFTTFSYLLIYLLAVKYQKQYGRLIDSIEETIKDPRNKLFNQLNSKKLSK